MFGARVHRKNAPDTVVDLAMPATFTQLDRGFKHQHQGQSSP